VALTISDYSVGRGLSSETGTQLSFSSRNPTSNCISSPNALILFYRTAPKRGGPRSNDAQRGPFAAPRGGRGMPQFARVGEGNPLAFLVYLTTTGNDRGSNPGGEANVQSTLGHPRPVNIKSRVLFPEEVVSNPGDSIIPDQGPRLRVVH